MTHSHNTTAFALSLTFDLASILIKLRPFRMVSKCALREKKKASSFPGDLCAIQAFCCVFRNKYSSNIVGSMFRISGRTFSRIAPVWISLRVLAFRSLTRFGAWTSSRRCWACRSSFFSSVIMAKSSFVAVKKAARYRWLVSGRWWVMVYFCLLSIWRFQIWYWMLQISRWLFAAEFGGGLPYSFKKQRLK